MEIIIALFLIIHSIICNKYHVDSETVYQRCIDKKIKAETCKHIANK
jgi:hypothetical protein